jgi:glycosyltransferase involved in cell wall biosynthesis
MPEIIARLKSGIAAETADKSLLEDALREIAELRQRRDALEEILIMLARTELPWDADGTPGEGFTAFQERYHRLMHEATDLLGLELRSTINRTEPRT